MPEHSKFDKETKAYFESLPAFIQEDLMQSNVCFENKKQMENFVENLMKSNRPHHG